MEIYLIILIRRHQRCKNRHCVKCIICIKYMVDISANPKWLYVVQGIDHGREGVTTTPEWFVVRHRDKFSERLITATEDLEVFRKTYELLWKTYKFSGKLTNLSIVLTNFSEWFLTSPEILKFPENYLIAPEHGSVALTNCSEHLWVLRKTYKCSGRLITATKHLLTTPEHFRNCPGTLTKTCAFHYDTSLNL